MEGSLLAASATTFRLIAGWACCALGLLDLTMGIDTSRGTLDGSYLLFHLVLLAAGVLLLSLGLLRRRPGRAAWLAGGGVAVAGLVVSAVPRTQIVCCLLEFPVRHGYPFTFLARGSGGWHVSALHVVTDLLFWLCVGLFALVAVTLLVRRPPAHAARDHHPAHAEHRAMHEHHPAHAEQSAPEKPAAVSRGGGEPGPGQP